MTARQHGSTGGELPRRLDDREAAREGALVVVPVAELGEGHGLVGEPGLGELALELNLPRLLLGQLRLGLLRRRRAALARGVLAAAVTVVAVVAVVGAALAQDELVVPGGGLEQFRPPPRLF
jgi:hypothetical protein